MQWREFAHSHAHSIRRFESTTLKLQRHHCDSLAGRVAEEWNATQEATQTEWQQSNTTATESTGEHTEIATLGTGPK